MKDLYEIVKETERETGKPCEVTVKTIGEKSEEEVYGDLKKRSCIVIPVYTGRDKEIREDAENLRGNYENLDSIEKKIREFGFESYSREEGERKVVGGIGKKADKLSRKRTLCGSILLFDLFELVVGKKGMLTKIKKEKGDEEAIKQLKKVLGAETGVFYDMDKKRNLMRKEFREHNLKFLNRSYLVQDDGIYLHTADLHPGFMMGVGGKVAEIKYALFDIVMKEKRVGGGSSASL